MGAFDKASPFRPPPTAVNQVWLVELDGVRHRLTVRHIRYKPAVVLKVEPPRADLRGELADVRAMGPRLLMRLR